MSKEINNSEYRQKVIKDLLEQLHAGKPVEEVKAVFEEAFDGVSASEIAQAENELIAGGLPVEEVQKLCDVHAAVFKGSVEDIHRPSDPAQIPGHPAHILKEENRAVSQLMENRIKPRLAHFLQSPTSESLKSLSEAFSLMPELFKHYLKKENVLFPHLEKHGITAPPKVMWGVDDDIRSLVREAFERISDYDGDAASLAEAVKTALDKASEMITKENNILLPMMLEHFTQEEWAKIAEDSAEMGTCLIPPQPRWHSETSSPKAETHDEDNVPSAMIILPTGNLKLEELTGLLNALPVDITFVDREDTVKYFSQGSERIFPRTKSIIGRKVINCHPPASMHIVEKILEDFKAGKKDHEDFWLPIHGKYIFIRYFAIRDEKGEYIGTLEVTQDIAPIQKIEGEKRLVSDD